MSNIVWATASNTWQTASIWNFWNEDTQQIEPYGRSPQNGDTVYLNGFTVTSTSNINIGNGLITNDANDTYGIIAGGQLVMNLRGWTITANLFAKQDHLINSSTTQLTALESIIGNVENEDGYVIYYSGSYTGAWYRNININGNIHLRNQDMNYYMYQNLTAFPTVSTVTITGNIVIDNPSKRILANRTVTDTVSVGGNMTGGKISDTINNFVLGGKLTQTAQQGSITTATFSNEVEILDGAYLSGTTVNLNDNLIIHDGSYLAFTTVNFNKVDGSVKIGHNSSFSATTHNFAGRKIEYYDDSFGVCGITVGVNSMFNPQNADFQWINLSEPRTLKYIILTDADMNNTDQYPSPANVKKDVPYAWGELVGQYLPDYPPESVVLQGYEYDNGNKTGNMSASAQVGCVTKEDVREGVSLLGMGEVGTLVVPSVDDVREGVIFDNGSVGTLIVQGGGDRLRIADFGYYTRSTSITYIVDLTESDKPAFADCEEIVLRSLFPTLDLNNIPDKFFDDLFIQFLRYRLLVEYYRGTSINSKFTPSEPTTEIVNYANTKCEYWLNTANLFLQLWGEKYPNSVKKDRILL